MTETTDTERMVIEMDLRSATMRAQFEYRNQAVKNLLSRIEDCVRLVRENDYDEAEALRMIDLQCQRVRMIDEALAK